MGEFLGEVLGEVLGDVTADRALRPEVPILMRPGSRIQFGVEPTRSLVLPLSDGIAPGPVFSALLAAHRGKPLAGELERVRRSASLPELFISELSDDLHRAGLTQRSTRRRRITIIGRDGLRTGLYEGLRRIGNGGLTRAMVPGRNATRWLAETDAERIGLVVMTGMEVPSLPLIRVLYHRGIPHLHTHFRDGALIIGPLVAPGDSGKASDVDAREGPGACAMCIEAHRRDADPARELIALQLRAYVPVAAPEWTAAAVSLLLGQLKRQDLSGLRNREIRIDLENLDMASRTFAPHPACPVCSSATSRRTS
nr:bacteriocin biosynthesis cyclodehydratase [Corynebacterium lactis]